MVCKSVNWRVQAVVLSVLALLGSGCESESDTSTKKEPISIKSREHKCNLHGTDYRIVEMEFEKPLKAATMIGRQDPVILCYVFPNSDITALLTDNGSVVEAKIMYPYPGDLNFGTDFLSDGNNVYFAARSGDGANSVYTIRALYITKDVSAEYKTEERVLFRDVPGNRVQYLLPRLIYQGGSDSESMILVRRDENYGDSPDTYGKRFDWFTIPCITDKEFALDEVVLGRDPKYIMPEKIEKLYEALSGKFGESVGLLYEDGLNYLFRKYPNTGLGRLYWVRELR